MPSIKRDRFPKHDKFNELQKKAEQHAETNDCSVKALAAVTGKDYGMIRSMLALKGRRHGQGTRRIDSLDVLRELGFDLVRVEIKDIIKEYPKPHCDVLKSVTTHHPDRFPAVWRDGHRYLFFTRGHMLAVVNGHNVDWTRGHALRVWRIERVINTKEKES